MNIKTRIASRYSAGSSVIRYTGGCRPITRGLGVLPKSAVKDSLISVLKDELKYEREYYRKDEVLLEDPPGEFQIDSPPGKNSFYLLKVWIMRCTMRLTIHHVYDVPYVALMLHAMIEKISASILLTLMSFKEFEGESIVIEVDLNNQPEKNSLSEFEEEEDDEDDDGAKTDGESDEELAIPVRFQVRPTKSGL